MLETSRFANLCIELIMDDQYYIESVVIAFVT